MPTQFDQHFDQHFATLELDPRKIKGMSSDDAQKAIRGAWKKLVLIHHPDKKGNAEKFRAVNDAFTALKGYDGISKKGLSAESERHMEMSRSKIYEYYTQQTTHIPEDAFDLLMEAGIQRAFERLETQFSEYSSDGERRAFVNHYASFFNLVLALEKAESDLTVYRADTLYRRGQETLAEALRRDWKILFIRLFGEEYLDDFQYREALLGNLWPILAIRKLISPIKWLALITASLNLLVITIGYQEIKKFNKYGTYILFLGSPFYTINLLVESMACPINNLVRPLSDYTKIPPLIFTVLLASMGIGVAYGFTYGSLTLSMATLKLVLPYITVSVNVYTCYTLYQVIKFLINAGREEQAIKAGVLGACILFFNFIPSSAPIADFLVVLGNFVVYHTIKSIIEERPIDLLPLPQNPASQEIKQATLSGYTEATQSHYFFGTPKEANFENNRSIWQKSCSFFGLDRAAPRRDIELKIEPPRQGLLA